jgi:hypothetical protein
MLRFVYVNIAFLSQLAEILNADGIFLNHKGKLDKKLDRWEMKIPALAQINR